MILQLNNLLNSSLEEKPFEHCFYYVTANVNNIEFKNDELLVLLNKYQTCLNKYSNISISNEEGEIILKNYDESNNLLINILFDFFLSTNSIYRRKSRLVEHSKEYLKNYFERGNRLKHNLFIILNWVLYKYPESKLDLKEIIYNSLIKTNEPTMTISILLKLINEKSLIHLLTNEQLINLYHKLYKIDVDHSSIQLYLNLYKNYIIYFSQTEYSKKFIKKYCDFYIKNIKYFEDLFNLFELPKVRDFMVQLNYDDKDLYNVDHSLKEIGKRFKNKFKKDNQYVSKKTSLYLDKQESDFRNMIDSLSQVNKLKKLIENVMPFSVSKLKLILKIKDKLSFF